MKNNSSKNSGTAISILAAMAVAILFWLIVKALDAGVIGSDGVTAFVSDIVFGDLL